MARNTPASLGGQWRIVEGEYPSAGSPYCVLIQYRTGTRWDTVAAFAPSGALSTDQVGAGLPLLVYTLATRPAATVGNRGTIILLSDAGYQGGADVIQTCVKTSGGSYEWIDVGMASS